NGHRLRPSGLVIDNYVRKMPAMKAANRHIKTWAQPHKVQCWNQVHFPTYLPGHLSVNENWEPVTGGAFAPVHIAKVQLNHYFTRSYQDWEDKMKRGRADVPSGRYG